MPSGHIALLSFQRPLSAGRKGLFHPALPVPKDSLPHSRTAGRPASITRSRPLLKASGDFHEPALADLENPAGELFDGHIQPIARHGLAVQLDRPLGYQPARL